MVENIVQALARIIVGEQMLKIRERYRPVLTVHDAAVIVAPKSELNEAVAVKDSEDAIKAITLTVSQTDGAKKKDSAAGTKSYNPAKEKIIVDDEDEVEVPKKVEAKKPAPAADPKASVSALVAEWDDE